MSVCTYIINNFEYLADYSEDDDLSDYSERPELTQFDSQRPVNPAPERQPPAPEQQPPAPEFRPNSAIPSQFRPELTPQLRPEVSTPPAPTPEEDEDENLLLPEVTESTGQFNGDGGSSFSFPQDLGAFGDTFAKFSPDRPESIGERERD